MMTHPRVFLLDENMPRRVLTSLRREGFTAMRVYDVGLRSQADATIFAYARAQHMTIITFDTDYLNQTAFPPPHAGLLVLRFFPRDVSVTELASVVLKAVVQLERLDISNRVYQLDPDGLEEECQAHLTFLCPLCARKRKHGHNGKRHCTLGRHPRLQ